MKKFSSPLAPVVCSVLLSACASHSIPNSPLHITEAPPPAGSIPEPVQQSVALPPPKPAAKVETFSVTVHKVPVQSLLFALARDAGMNVDVHPGLEGTVTLNALDQTLPQLLSRIQRQVDMRYEINGSTLTVLPDTPEWRNYKVDYVNIARSTTSSVSIATQISTTGGGSGDNNQNAIQQATQNNTQQQTLGPNGLPVQQPQQQYNSAQQGSGSNNSTTSVTNRSDNNFWYNLEKNIRDMLRASNLADNPVDPLATQQQSQQGGPGVFAAQPAAPDPNAARIKNSVIVNPEGGLIAVRATARQHEKIQQFLDVVLGAAKRQVLIEATIIEVKLSDNYQQGIDWKSVGKGGLTLTQQRIGSDNLPSGVKIGTSPGVFLLNYANPTSRIGDITAAIQLLESFGKVKVLSSPKISVLNNQTALLKVVDNNVFFSIKVTPAVLNSSGGVSTPATYESTLQTVPVGFVMSVTPQISDSDDVTLNVRPTITRVVDYVKDPNPALVNVPSQIPIIQAREMESIMRVSSGQVAVMGGLMQDSVDNKKDGIPGLSSLPLVGNLFSYRNENSTKTELVIFMRPVVVKDASINGDYKDYRYMLPGQKPDNEPYPVPKANGS